MANDAGPKRGQRRRSKTARRKWDRDTVLADYRTAYSSRQASLIGRKEVLTGKAKFGIFGDGKELPQLALAKVFRPGDFRSGYYRDQTWALATGMTTLEAFFAQLYAHPDREADPASGGRQMNAHFATRLLDDEGCFVRIRERCNSAADLSPVSSQMPRLVGLAYASTLYRKLPELRGFEAFSEHGNEVAFGSIGNAGCAEGMFWEAINALGVVQAPAVVSIWDDGFGISVPNAYQIARPDLADLLSGFQRRPGERGGCEIMAVEGWDYPALIETYEQADKLARAEHVPVVIHVRNLTQPQGHSTSGSHERYKSKERLQWEQDFDGIARMRSWIIEQHLAGDEELNALEAEALAEVREAQRRAWKACRAPIEAELETVTSLIRAMAAESSAHSADLSALADRLSRIPTVYRRDIFAAIADALILSRDEASSARRALIDWKNDQESLNHSRYDADLYAEKSGSALQVTEVPVAYDADPPRLNGFEILNRFFDMAFSREPRLIAMGEDVGKLGDVNQGMVGLQEKYGPLRVSDTGIRECTIVGQAIGMALRGLRPLAEIQYLDYVLYALQLMSDDLATLRYRTRGGQTAPVIIRTRGHRLEGIWHSGSPMAALVHLCRGMYICVPRDMTRAAGMYNTLLQSQEPGVVVEVLNGYRLKEPLPSNLDRLTIPLGIPEILREGSDVTIVTYGATCRIVMEAAEQLQRMGIEAEVIDVQTLLPFDRHGIITESLKKTSRIVFVDEDVPGGTTGYMMREVLEVQGGYHWLDAEPRCISGKAHRPAYGSDGDYFSKPNREQILEAVHALMHESDPARFPLLFQ